MNWHSRMIERLVALALEEDAAGEDITSRTLIDARWRAVAEIRAKERGVVSGLPLARMFFQRLDRRISFRSLVKDSSNVKDGQILARIEGSARSLLTAERPALNALQHLSGIATFVAQQVKRLGRSNTKLFDTRKTIPGWRLLEKYAVRCGGAQNHRMSLSDAMLIKENHIKLARLAGSLWVERVRNFRRRSPHVMVQIEIQRERDLTEALRARPQRVLLDNMPNGRLRRAINLS